MPCIHFTDEQKGRANAPREKVKQPFELPPAGENNRRAFAYLRKQRRPDPDVFTAFKIKYDETEKEIWKTVHRGAGADDAGS